MAERTLYIDLGGLLQTKCGPSAERGDPHLMAELNDRGAAVSLVANLLFSSIHDFA